MKMITRMRIFALGEACIMINVLIKIKMVYLTIVHVTVGALDLEVFITTDGYLHNVTALHMPHIELIVS